MCGIIACLSGGDAAAFGEIRADWRALADLRHEERDREITNLDPGGTFPGQVRRESKVTMLLSGDITRDNWNIEIQLRAVGESNPRGEEVTPEADEFFVEKQAAHNTFAFVGRRNIAFGQAYGVSPADVFLDLQAEDRSLNESRRRRELNGQDMLGVETFASENATFLLFAAPATGEFNRDRPDRFLAAANLLFPDWRADATLLAFEDARPGIAWSTSKAAGNAVVLYLDGALRKGRDRNTVKRTGAPAEGSFTLNDADDDRMTPSAAIGGGYTFHSGIGVNLEYIRNGEGYNSGEWRVFEELIRVNADNFRAGASAGPAADNLRNLNTVLDSFLLRKNYLFGRLQIPNLASEGLSTEITCLHNLDDGSGVLSARLEKDLPRQITAGAYASLQYGGRFSEFGLRPATTRGTVYATIRF